MAVAQESVAGRRWPAWGWAWALVLAVAAAGVGTALAGTASPFVVVFWPRGALGPAAGWAWHVAASAALGWGAWRWWRRPFLGVASAGLMAFHPLGAELARYGVCGWMFAATLLVAAGWGVAGGAGRVGKALGAALALVGAAALLWAMASALGMVDYYWDEDVAIAKDLGANPLWAVFGGWTRHLRLALMGWPLCLAPDQAVAGVKDGRFWMGALWLAVAAWGAWKARKAWPEMCTGLAWMLAGHLATWGLSCVANVPLAADAYAYAVLPGAALAVGTLLDRQGKGVARWAGWLCLMAVLAGLSGVRAYQWKTTGPWGAAAAANPRSLDALVALSDDAMLRGDDDAAKTFRKEAVRLGEAAEKAVAERMAAEAAP